MPQFGRNRSWYSSPCSICRPSLGRARNQIPSVVGASAAGLRHIALCEGSRPKTSLSLAQAAMPEKATSPVSTSAPATDFCQTAGSGREPERNHRVARKHPCRPCQLGRGRRTLRPRVGGPLGCVVMRPTRRGLGLRPACRAVRARGCRDRFRGDGRKQRPPPPSSVAGVRSG